MPAEYAEKSSSTTDKASTKDSSPLPAKKRKQLNDDNNESGNESKSQDPLPPQTTAFTMKKTKSSNTTTRTYPSVNELKKRIRDTKRLLSKDDLSADVRVLQERALSTYSKELEEEKSRRKRSDMIKRYHFVRFLGMLLALALYSSKLAGTLTDPNNC